MVTIFSVFVAERHEEDQVSEVCYTLVATRPRKGSSHGQVPGRANPEGRERPRRPLHTLGMLVGEFRSAFFSSGGKMSRIAGR